MYLSPASGKSASFDNGTATPTEAHSNFLASVEADKIAIAEQRAKADADFFTGLRAF
jgi:hypothetical protein